MEALLRWNPEKPDFCEAKSHPKNKNSKLDICPDILSFLSFLVKIEKSNIFFVDFAYGQIAHCLFIG